MELQTVIDEHFGGNASAMARELRVTPAAVNKWRHKGMSEQRAAQIELWILKNKPVGATVARSPEQIASLTP